MALDKIGIRVSPLSGRILLARFGKDPSTALETRDAMDDVLKAIVGYAFDCRMPAPSEAVEIRFGSGDEQFALTVRRTEEQSA